MARIVDGWAKAARLPAPEGLLVVGWPPFSDQSISGGNVKRSRILVLGALAAVTASALLAAGCGAATRARRHRPPAPGAVAGLQDGLVTDIGGLDDNELQPPCLRRDPAGEVAAGIDFKVLESAQESEYVPNLQAGGRPLRPRDRGRFLIDGAISRSRRPSRRRTSRSSTTRRPRPWRTSRGCSSTSRSRAISRLPGGATSKTGTVSTVGGQKVRRSTTTSRATSPAPRRRTRR